MLKKIVAILLCLMIFSVCIIATEAETIEVSSQGYVLYNPDNNEVVESKNGETRMFPASLTKMLTALVVMDLAEDIDTQQITVSENAVQSLYGTSSSTANLKIGETFTVHQLLYLMLLPSGNDAANALAEFFCGDNSSFAVEMNQKAKEIGMNNSNFCNPHGLHDYNHFTTAVDLAILADAYLDDSVLKEIALCNEYTVNATNKQGERKICTTNFMKLYGSGYYYEYTTGLKTGNTDEAGRCLAASAEKDGKRYICIMLNSPEKWVGKNYIRTEFLEAAEVFKYAFDNYECVKVAEKGLKIGSNAVYETYSKQVSLVLENDVYATLPKGTNVSGCNIDFTVDNLNLDGLLLPDITKGEKLGNAVISLNGKRLGETAIVADNTVTAHWWLSFWHKIDLYVYIATSVIAFLLLMTIVMLIRKKIIIYKRKKAKIKRAAYRQKMQEEFQKQEPIDYFNLK